MATNLNSTKSSSSDIKKFSIAGNEGGKTISLKSAITDFRYYESILDPTIRVNIIFTDTGNSLDGKNVLRELPIVGTEKCEITIVDNNENEVSLEMLVNNVNPLDEGPKQTTVNLALVSKEFILNELSRVNLRFDGKLSDHISKILTESQFIGTTKPTDVEETQNNYNFFGNNRKPIYTCSWLAKKAVPVSSSVGKSAGFFFYETHLGFKFKSIDSLIAQEPKRKLIFTETSDERGSQIPEGYDGKILALDNGGNFNAQTKLESGAYSERHVKFDPFDCFYEVTTQTAEETESGYELAGNELPTLNPELNAKLTNFTKTTYSLVDRGVIPSGSSEQQVEKSKEINLDYSNIVNQAQMRYNQLFTIKKSITIPGDFSLNAGDAIFLDIPETSADKMNQKFDPQTGGLYIIADLCHFISPERCLTKLNLVRDSYGRKVT
jgi:hypothetical protein